jgi:hypothetical protein
VGPAQEKACFAEVGAAKPGDWPEGDPRRRWPYAALVYYAGHYGHLSARKAGPIETVGRFVVQIIRLVLGSEGNSDPEPTPQVPSDLIHYKTKPQDKGKSATGRTVSAAAISLGASSLVPGRQSIPP